jgi:phosphate starvation-inducible PhoH-like protein
MAAGDGVFGVGPQGSGKTFLPAAFGACLLNDGDVRKMVVCRPTTDAGESLGFLPGGLEEKLEPWMVPIFDAIDKTVGRQKRIAWQRAGMLEVCSFQHMQGRTFEDSFVLLDEAQNADNMQMETFLTRIGVGSRYVVAGDPFAQRVARGPGGFARAIEHARRHGLPVPIVEMTYQDIQRHEHARLWALAFHDDHTQPEKRP